MRYFLFISFLSFNLISAEFVTPNSGGVRVRSGPGTNYSALFVLDDGGVAKVKKMDGKWIEVELINGESTYVSAEHVELMGGWPKEVVYYEKNNCNSLKKRETPDLDVENTQPSISCGSNLYACGRDKHVRNEGRSNEEIIWFLLLANDSQCKDIVGWAAESVNNYHYLIPAEAYRSITSAEDACVTTVVQDLYETARSDVDSIWGGPEVFHDPGTFSRSASIQFNGYNFTADDVTLISRLVYSEAGGFDLNDDERDAVTWVVLNRLYSNKNEFRNKSTVESVVFHKNQFENVPNGEKFSASKIPQLLNPEEQFSYNEAKESVLRVLSGKVPDPTGGAEFFHSPRSMQNVSNNECNTKDLSLRSRKWLCDGLMNGSLEETHVDGVRIHNFRFFRYVQ